MKNLRLNLRLNLRSGRLLLTGGLLLTLPAFGVADSAYQQVREGNTFYRAGDYRAAAAAYAKAAEAQPDAAEIYYNLGNVYYKRFIFDQALEHYSRALRTAPPRLGGRIKYNLGNVKYQQAIASMLTFQDAATPLRAAIGYYRDSLKVDPAQTDARYNLELAHKMMIELRKQKVQAQNNPEMRNQKTSDNQGQGFEESAERQSQQRDLPQDQTGDKKTQGQQAQQAPQTNVSTEQSSQTQQAQAPQEMTPEQAERIVEIVRERARAAEAKRQQWRRARMQDAQVEKFW